MIDVMDYRNEVEQKAVNVEAIRKHQHAKLQIEQPDLTDEAIAIRVEEIIARGLAVPTKAVSPQPTGIPKAVLDARREARRVVKRNLRDRRRQRF